MVHLPYMVCVVQDLPPFLSSAITLLFPAFTLSSLLTHSINSINHSQKFPLTICQHHSCICKLICYHCFNLVPMFPTLAFIPFMQPSIKERAIMMKKMTSHIPVSLPLLSQNYHRPFLSPSHIHLFLYNMTSFLPVAAHPRHRLSERSEELPCQPCHMVIPGPLTLHTDFCVFSVTAPLTLQMQICGLHCLSIS